MIKCNTEPSFGLIPVKKIKRKDLQNVNLTTIMKDLKLILYYYNMIHSYFFHSINNQPRHINKQCQNPYCIRAELSSEFSYLRRRLCVAFHWHIFNLPSPGALVSMLLGTWKKNAESGFYQG